MECIDKALCDVFAMRMFRVQPFLQFKPDDENLVSVDSKELQENGIINAGSWIGIFERFIMLVFLSLNQFSAIGFVLTAKSIARYKRITDDPKFSEYYLLGTLLSTIFAICTRFLIF